MRRDKNICRGALRLALPIAAQNLVVFSAGIADGLLAAPLGDTAVSAVYMGNQVALMLSVLLAGMDGALLLLGARYSGAGQRRRIGPLLGISVLLCAALSLAVSALCFFAPEMTVFPFARDSGAVGAGGEYLSVLAISFLPYALSQSGSAAMRSIGRARAGVYASALALAVKLTLSFILIPRMGIRGAALATVIGRCAEALCVWIYIFVFGKDTELKPSSLFSFDKQITGEYVKYGLPIMGSQVVWAINTFASGALLGLERSEGAIAAIGMAGTLGSLSFVFLNGLSSAFGITVSAAVGDGREDAVLGGSLAAERIAVLAGAAVGGAMYALRGAYLSLYSVSPAAIEYARPLILILALSAPITAYQSVLVQGVIKSRGEVGFVLCCDAFGTAAVSLPLALVARRLEAPLWAVFLALKSEQAVKCALAAIKIRKDRKAAASIHPQ